MRAQRELCSKFSIYIYLSKFIFCVGDTCSKGFITAFVNIINMLEHISH